MYEAPAHPYTRALLSAVPLPDPAAERARERVALLGDPSPSSPLRASGGGPHRPAAPPPGCAFHPRCPKAQPVCRAERPVLRPLTAAEPREVACHFPD